MEQIKATIQALVKELKSGQKTASRDNPQALLKKLFTRKELKHLQLSACRNGILSLKVDSASWVYYLNLKKRELLIKFAQNSRGAKDIRFSIGEIAGQQ